MWISLFTFTNFVHSLERELACLLSLFAIAPIPWSLVEKCLPEEDEENLKNSRDKLFSLSLLQRKEKDTYQLHELIQKFLRDKQKKLANAEQQKSQLCNTIATIAQEISQTTTLQDINYFNSFIPHIIKITTLYQDWLSNKDLIQPFIRLSNFYESQGAYPKALPWKEQCIQATKKRFREEHLSVATSLNNLASLHYNQEKYKAAEPLYLKALEIAEKILGNNHPTTITINENYQQLINSQN